MDVTAAINTRQSVRGFLPDPVPAEVIRDIIDTARKAPSNSNTQPWHISVVSGAARDELEHRILEGFKEGRKQNPHWPPSSVGLEGKYKDRQYACAWNYYSTMGVARDDKEGRQDLLLRNWKFFGAPHALFLSMPQTMHHANAVDIGIMLQTLMLLMTERGIGSIAQGALASFPDEVRAVVHVPEGNAILCGISFGYADSEALINTVKMSREPLDSIASFAE